MNDMNEFGQVVQKVVEDVNETLKQVVQDISSGIADFVNGLQNFWNEIKCGVVDIVQGFVGGVKQIVEEVKPAIQAVRPHFQEFARLCQSGDWEYVVERAYRSYFIQLAHAALDSPRSRDIKPFLLNELGLSTHPDYQYAFWKVFQRPSPALFRQPIHNLSKYCARAVSNEVRRYRTSLKREEELGWKTPDGKAIQSLEHENSINLATERLWDDPVNCVLQEEQHLEALSDVKALPLLENQRNLLALLLEGHTPADAVKLSGTSWSTYQSLQRKVRRRLR